MAKEKGFHGSVRTEWLVEPEADRQMVLLEDFEFVDDDGVAWPAKRDDVIDGASIPRFLWSTFPGSPYIGEYRRAAALHDSHYIHRYGGSRRAVDRVFYAAMRFDGTSRFKAVAMYVAVRLFGGSYWDSKVLGAAISGEMQDLCWAIADWAVSQPGEVDLDAIDERCKQDYPACDIDN
ncbi:MAG: DUF1353 domain-containing protein [Phycisphaeraceae bacterium]